MCFSFFADFHDTNLTIAEGGSVEEEDVKSILIEDRMEFWAEHHPEYLHKVAFGGLADILFLAQADMIVASPSQFSEVAVVTSLGIKGYSVPHELIWDSEESFESLRPCFVMEGAGLISGSHCLIPYHSEAGVQNALQLTPSKASRVPSAFSAYLDTNFRNTQDRLGFWEVVNMQIGRNPGDADYFKPEGGPMTEEGKIAGVAKEKVESNSSVLIGLMTVADLNGRNLPLPLRMWVQANAGNYKELAGDGENLPRGIQGEELAADIEGEE